MMQTYRSGVNYFEDVTIRADFAQASCPVEGTNGRQVADFAHSPRKALRYAIEQSIRDDGEDPDSFTGEISLAVDSMVAEEEEETACKVCGDGLPLSGPDAATRWHVCASCASQGYTGADGDDVRRATAS